MKYVLAHNTQLVKQVSINCMSEMKLNLKVLFKCNLQVLVLRVFLMGKYLLMVVILCEDCKFLNKSCGFC